MGLRIIGTKRAIPSLTDDETVEILQEAAKSWPYGRIARDTAAENEFLMKYREARGRVNALPGPDILAMAESIEARIRGAYVREVACHSRVDIATLLELL